jgi:hypothetical protein
MASVPFFEMPSNFILFYFLCFSCDTQRILSNIIGNKRTSKIGASLCVKPSIMGFIATGVHVQFHLTHTLPL